MASRLPVRPRWVVGAIALIVVGALMYQGTVTVEVGTSLIVAILAGLGVYQKRTGGSRGGGSLP